MIARIDAALPRAAWTGRIVADAVEPDPIADIEREADAELDAALFVVATIDDVAALQAIGLLAQLAGEPAALTVSVGLLAVVPEPLLVAVGAVPLALLREIREQVPTCTVRTLPGVASVAAALGYCGSIGWRDHELDAHRRTWLAIAREARVELPAADAEPRDDASADYVPMPVHVLPPACRRIVEEGSRAQGVDPAFWGVPLLGILAGCIGATRRVRLQRTWCEPPVLNTATNASSGSGKSPAQRVLTAPVRERDRQLHERTVALQAAAEAAAAAGGKGSRPQRVPHLCAMVGDATMEALIWRGSDNPRGFLYYSDELTGWFGSMDCYRAGGDEARWLSIYDAGPVSVDRKTNDAQRLYVPALAISVVGSIQPRIAAKVLGSPERRASGLAARMLLCMPPVSCARWSDDELSQSASDGWGFVVRGLLDLDLGDEGRGIELALSPDARALFVDYVNANGIETHRAILAGDHDIAAVLAKLRGAAARIALVLALARAAEDGTSALLRTVDATAVRAGIELATWFAGEARRIYRHWDSLAAERSASDDKQTLRDLAETLWQAMATGPQSRNQLHDATGRNHDGARLDAALAILKGSGRAVCERQKPVGGGRPREVWQRTGGVS